MKKLLIITLAFCAVIVAMACGSNDLDVDGVTGATEQNGESGEGTAKGKMLLVYFSRADENWQVGYVERCNTAIMADYIMELADVDVFEIVPEVAYQAAYNECISYVNDIEIPQLPNATVLESLGIAGVSIRDASSKQTVENWLKKLGVGKQSTAINNVHTRSVDNGVSYTLNGMPSNNQRGLYIKRSDEGRLQSKNGKKYVSK